MKWLLWREYRLNRLILAAGVVLLLLPHLVALVLLLCVKIRQAGNMEAMHVTGTEMFFVAALYSLVLSQLTVALLGGNALAGERADRSAEFVAYLPLSRRRLLASKLSLAFSAMVSIWGPNLLILLILLGSLPERESREFSPVLSQIAVIGLVIYGVSWLVSSLQSSPVFAVCAGLITPFLIAMGLAAAAWATDAPVSTFGRFQFIGYAIICPALAILCFSAGTWHYLRRVEP